MKPPCQGKALRVRRLIATFIPGLRLRPLAFMGVLLTSAVPLSAQTGAPLPDRLARYLDQTFSAADTLDPGEASSADAKDCLEQLCWEPGSFQVTCERPTRGDRGDLLVRFASPINSGDEQNDRVAMEWYVARDAQSKPIAARAVIVVHESGSKMPVGRLIARTLRLQGMHAFMIHLPHYGQRRAGDKRPQDANLLLTMRQAIADVRRARDAAAALPLVNRSHIALQGTSLGGFVAATSAGLDRGYDTVFLVLAGGKLYELLQQGTNEAAEAREELARLGLEGEKLKAVAWTIEPTRLAHRLDPNRTWLYSGSFDRVVPLKNALALAKAARLDERHHVPMLANHYSGIIFLPTVLGEIEKQVTTLDARPR